ncbi:MAG: hypothetical protein K1X55_01515 [Chitinophagales bacterium]|nr:hypothetical protein [Chitinophagales bacterium]
MQKYKLEILSYNQPVLIGGFMLIFSRRRVDVTDFYYKNINDTDGLFTIEFNSEEWAAQNLEKQCNKHIDIFEAKLVSIVK